MFVHSHADRFCFPTVRVDILYHESRDHGESLNYYGRNPDIDKRQLLPNERAS